MSLSFNSGGLITRGFGEKHRIITRGMSGRFEFGGIYFRRKYKLYSLEILIPIYRDKSKDIKFFWPLKRKNKIIKEIFWSLSKKAEKSFEIKILTDHEKLIKILDEI